MKPLIFAQPLRRTHAAILLTTVLLQAVSGPLLPATQAATNEKAEGASAADLAWKEVEKGFRPPTFPPEWQKERPSQEEYAKFIVPHLVKAAKAANAFAAKYPSNENAAAAKKRALEFFTNAANLGSSEAIAEVKKIETERLQDKSISEEDRFGIRASQVQRAAMAKQSEGMKAVFAEFEKGARGLLKEFPSRNEPYEMLLEVASNTEGEGARKLADELLASKASDEVKSQVKLILKKAEMIGKPVPIKFKAVDGRDIDLAALKGKVVLVDFWATWCGPCVQEVPNVVAAYEKLHPKGFEIIGISFDQSKESLTKFVAENKMTWAQYFDGLGWKNEIGKEYGINSIPAMWLVDKKGQLRDMNARGDLEEKVGKLLAE